ncbi:hypothetical protein G6321_00050230 [Bradyrhizobium barranii subsp. barranii]|uniref:Uncharacterized protein n=1 Tax=Bradyrhizobium barranii subsp. barranii TaxID=2823807 RepID=A0A7Z0Q9D1_9BRAD|nr:hypothetical protein [Bradyrhizobium barranii]UGX93676.1 hypothetical protein G6321_00050230 [Bradyrhizobium barranii subsp. barranii]
MREQTGKWNKARTRMPLWAASQFDDIAAIIRTTVLAIVVSLDKPEDDPERRIAIISDDGREIGTVPVYSRPSYENPAK